LQNNLLVGVDFSSLNKNISFLIKYGVLVLVLSINYALNKPKKQSLPKVIPVSNLDLSENKLKKTTVVLTENQKFINYFHR